MAKSGNGESGNGENGNGENGNGGSNPGFSVSYDSESGNYTPSGPTTPSWGPDNTPGGGDTTPAGLNDSEESGDTNPAGLNDSEESDDTNPAGLNDSENNKDSKNDININEEAAKNEASKKNAEKSNEAKALEQRMKHYNFNIKPNDEKSAKNEASKKNAKKSNEAQLYNYKTIHYDLNNKGHNEASKKNAEVNNTPTVPATTNNAPGETLGGETGTTSETAAPSVSDALNTGVTYRGGTVTDSGTGGSISSNINLPSRDASSIGLGVYNANRANYDQDNWNRGMESESSSLVSDEECKAFAKRAFMENSEPFKKVRILIVKKC